MEPVKQYFDAEKYESILFIAVGVGAALLAIYFLVANKQPFYKGMACPMLLVAAIQIVVGTTVLARTQQDIDRVQNQIANAKSEIDTQEIPRMKIVMRKFVVYRYVEIALLLLGIAVIIAASPLSAAHGGGYGLAMQAAIMLLLEFFAERRGAEYLAFLSKMAAI